MKFLRRASVGILIFLFQLSFASAGGDDVGNGGGLAEKTMILAYENLAGYSKLCLDLSSCRLTSKERSVLTLIHRSLLKQRNSKDIPLVFVSERKTPGFFILEGEPKIAKTGSVLGSKVYINTDLLYTSNPAKQIEPLSLPQAVAVLIHEFGHHVSTLSHQDLDLLGVKVSAVLLSHIQSTPALPWTTLISATVVQETDPRSFPQILLTVGSHIYDLSALFRENVFCPVVNIPIPILPLPDLPIGKEKPAGILFHNVHWEKVSGDETGEFKIMGNLTHLCPSGGSFDLINSYKLSIDFSVSRSNNGGVRLSESSLRLTQLSEPWYKIIRFNF